MRKRTARTPRFHITADIHCHSELMLDKRVSHHLVTVLRARKNDQLLLFVGDGYDYRATVLETGQRSAGKRACLQVHDRVQVQNESPLHITLIQCISRADRMDITLRQAVELGVSCIQPVYSQYSSKPLDAQRSAKRLAHWQSVVISACEQCGRAVVPALADAAHLTDCISEYQHHTAETAQSSDKKIPLTFALSPTAHCSLKQRLQQYPGRSSAQSAISLLAGPESGLAPEEVKLAVDAGMLEAHLGPRVLRTETAGATAIALTQTIMGDL